MAIEKVKPVPIFPVLMVNFIGMLGYCIVIPILVFLVKKFGGNEFIYGLLGSMYPAFQLIGAPLLGKWSDVIGRRSVLIVSQVGTFVAWMLFILALYLPKMELIAVDSTVLGSFLITLPLICLFIARAFDGLTGGNISVANAYLSDVSTVANRKANFGKMASSGSLGFVIGPAISGLLGASILGELLPVLVAAGVSLTAIAVIYFYLPESKQELVPPNLRDLNVRKLFSMENRECYKMDNCPDTGLRAILRYPQIPFMYLMYFIVFLGFSFFYASFPVFASGYMNWSAAQLGVFLTVSSGIMVLVQGPGLTYLSNKVDSARLVTLGSTMMVANFLLLPTGESVWVYTANVFLSVGNALMWPSFLAILATKGKNNVKGTIMGYANSMGSAASIFGLILGGTLFGQIGPNVFYISAAIFCIVFVLSFFLWKKEPSLELQVE